MRRERDPPEASVAPEVMIRVPVVRCERGARSERAHLAFVDFGSSSGSARLYAAPTDDGEWRDACNSAIPMARREGLEPPTLRFEA